MPYHLAQDPATEVHSWKYHEMADLSTEGETPVARRHYIMTGSRLCGIFVIALEVSWRCPYLWFSLRTGSDNINMDRVVYALDDYWAGFPNYSWC
jgi:hypothetical protein